MIRVMHVLTSIKDVKHFTGLAQTVSLGCPLWTYAGSWPAGPNDRPPGGWTAKAVGPESEAHRPSALWSGNPSSGTTS